MPSNSRIAALRRSPFSGALSAAFEGGHVGQEAHERGMERAVDLIVPAGLIDRLLGVPVDNVPLPSSDFILGRLEE